MKNPFIGNNVAALGRALNPNVGQPAAGQCCPPAVINVNNNMLDPEVFEPRLTKTRRELYRWWRASAPIENIPVVIPFGAMSTLKVTPGQTFDVTFDPVAALWERFQTPEYITADGTESNGGVTTSLAPSAGYTGEVVAIRHFYATDPDQSGVTNALETVTYNPRTLNANNAGASQTASTSEVNLGDVTDATNSFRFTIPAVKAGGVIQFFGTRITSAALTMPELALIRASIGSPGELAGGAWTISCATTLLTSGSLVRKSSEILSAASPNFDATIEYLLANYYEPL